MFVRRAALRALPMATVLVLALGLALHSAVAQSVLSPDGFAAMRHGGTKGDSGSSDGVARPAGRGRGGVVPIAGCCDDSHPISVSGEAEQTVENTITKVAISVRVSDSISLDTTPAIDINMQMQNPQAAQAAAQAQAARGLPTTPNAKQLDTMARAVMADADKRTKNVLSLIRATSAERLQTQGVSLQPTSVWVPKLNQQINNGYSASNFITFRIASAAMGTMLADLMSIGATNIDSVTHIPTEEALETGRRAAIRVATKRALARAQLAAGVLTNGPRLDIKNVQITTSNSIAAKPVAAPQMMFMRAEAGSAMAMDGGGTTAAGETEVNAFVSLQIDLMGYSSVPQIAPNDVM